MSITLILLPRDTAQRGEPWVGRQDSQDAFPWAGADWLSVLGQVTSLLQSSFDVYKSIGVFIHSFIHSPSSYYVVCAELGTVDMKIYKVFKLNPCTLGTSIQYREHMHACTHTQRL